MSIVLPGARFLIIEDDQEIADLVGLHVRDLGAELEHAADGETGLRMALEGNYELVILDLMLPRLDGMETCKRIREKDKGLPILMLSARSEEFDKVLGLELGADDYLTKPFSIHELIARIRALLRRVHAAREEASAPGRPRKIEIGGLSIDLELRKVALEGRPLELTVKEFDLLAFFAANPGKPFPREQLLNQVWGYSFSGYEHTVNTHINRLRAKIEADPSQPKFIQTVWGFGYRFADAEELAQ